MGNLCGRSLPGLLLASLVLLHCGGDAKRAPRLLVIGIDGASPRLIDALRPAGRLPHLEGLASRGVYLPLRSERPLFSPRLWNTIATGRHPRRHGIRHFIYGEGEERLLYTSAHRKAPAIWNILSHAGHSVSVVNWWTTHPPERINGVMVSDHFFPESVADLRAAFSAAKRSEGNLVHPAGFEPPARQAIETLRLPRSPFGADAVLPPWVDREQLEQQHRTDHQIAAVTKAILEREVPQALFVFLPGIDRVSHALWGCIEPAELYPPELRPTAGARAGGAEALHAYYEITDSLIGEILAYYEAGDHVVVLSDHGMEGGTLLAPLTGQHKSDAALDGVLFAAGPRVRHDPAPARASIYDILPLLLALADLPSARDLRGTLPGFVDAVAIPAIPSYDDTPVERMEGGDSGVEDEIVERLRALGYLEESP